MTFGLDPGKLGFKLGEVLVGLQSGTTDTPETISSTQNKLHTLGYVWNPDSLAYEALTGGGSGVGLEVYVTNSASTDAATIVDDASATVTYVGSAAPGAATSSAAWKIKKLTTTGSVLAITWADGDATANNVWDNRASLSYS